MEAKNILFKAKTTKGFWVEGDFVHHIHHKYAISQHGCITHGIDPSTLCMWTTKLDDDKNRVFTNDIDSHGYMCLFYNYMFQMCKIDEQGEVIQAIPLFNIHSMGEFKITHSIHDNPELIEHHHSKG